MRQTAPYLASLDSLRGLAALCIVLHHFRYLSVLDNNLIVNSRLMVDLFFVLSGFVIAMHYQLGINTTKDVLDFSKRRFWRLYPLHLLMLMVFIGIETLKFLASHVGHVQGIEPGFVTNSFAAIFTNLLLIHSLGIHDTIIFNFPSWSVSVEFYTYLLFACVTLWTPSKWRVGVYVVLAMMGAILLRTLGTHFTHAQDLGFFRCVFSFFTGCVGANVYEVLARRSFRINAFFAYLMIMLAAVLVYKAVLLFVLPWVFCLLILSLALMKQETVLNRLLNMRPLQYLGKISYSVYMAHAAVIWLMKFALIKIAHVPMTGKYLQLGLIPSLMVTLCLLASVIVVSHLTWRYVEERFRIKSQTKASSHASDVMVEGDVSTVVMPAA